MNLHHVTLVLQEVRILQWERGLFIILAQTRVKIGNFLANTCDRQDHFLSPSSTIVIVIEHTYRATIRLTISMNPT